MAARRAPPTFKLSSLEPRRAKHLEQLRRRSFEDEIGQQLRRDRRKQKAIAKMPCGEKQTFDFSCTQHRVPVLAMRTEPGPIAGNWKRFDAWKDLHARRENVLHSFNGDALVVSGPLHRGS